MCVCVCVCEVVLELKISVKKFVCLLKKETCTILEKETWALSRLHRKRKYLIIHWKPVCVCMCVRGNVNLNSEITKERKYMNAE